MDGAMLLAWIIGLSFLGMCVRVAVMLHEEPEPDPVFVDAMERAAEHDARMDARAAERGWVRS